MRTIEKYVCEVCGSEYHDMNDAFNCEARPEPQIGGDINIGDEIRFNKEDGGFGSRWSYTNGQGLVADKQIVLFTNNETGEEFHGYILYVECPMSNFNMIERRIVQNDNDGNWVSTAENFRGFDSIDTSEIPEHHERLKELKLQDNE